MVFSSSIQTLLFVFVYVCNNILFIYDDDVREILFFICLLIQNRISQTIVQTKETVDG
jgi:hypothetical protein